ncbi:MAG TPA: hypothetical protein VFB13_12085 [Reyranella sp.]|jgi:hypothetical protein|nr:hypothetical protein [Reyranella sp.]
MPATSIRSLVDSDAADIDIVGRPEMPLQWKIDAVRRRVTVTLRGEVSAREPFEYLDAIQQARAMPFAKIFDVTGLIGVFTDDLVRALGGMVARHSALAAPPGPLAIVASDPALRAQAELYARTATADRPVRIFNDAADAERWLDERERVNR